MSLDDITQSLLESINSELVSFIDMSRLERFCEGHGDACTIQKTLIGEDTHLIITCDECGEKSDITK